MSDWRVSGVVGVKSLIAFLFLIYEDEVLLCGETEGASCIPKAMEP